MAKPTSIYGEQQGFGVFIGLVQKYSNGVKRISINEKALTGIAEGDCFKSAVAVAEELRPQNTAYMFLPYSVSGQVGILNVRIYTDGTTAVYAYGRALAAGDHIFTDGLWV